MLKRSFAITALLAATLSPLTPRQADAQVNVNVTVSKGTYKDNGGTVHPWRIDAAHTLVWDDKPFVPVGGLFQAKSWARTPTDADFESDVAALQTLKSHGVTDIYLQPARVGLTFVPPAAIQKLTDYLDKEGFTYGISINDGPHDILVGYLVRPGAFRQSIGGEGGTLRFPLDSVASALYFLVSADGSEIIRSGDATMVAEGARVTVDPIANSGGTQNVVFLLPQKVSFGQATGGLPLPNLWDGFDEYRDSLLQLFSQVKLGKGFRFFIDALPQNLALNTDTERFIPSGPNWAQEWETYLAFRYKTLGRLHEAWGVTDRDVKSFDEAATLLPLWGGGKGVSILYDRANNKQHRVDTTKSAFWKDLSAFKEISVRDYMNDLAVSLKKAVADVPVVYRTRGESTLFTSLPRNRGFDGIGITAYGRGSDLVTNSAGYAYAEAAEAPKTTWLMVAATADAAPTLSGAATTAATNANGGVDPNQTEKTDKGYATQSALTGDLDALRSIGARGFYVEGARVVDPTRQSFNLVNAPEQLDWLSAYQRLLFATGVASAQTAPQAVFYPKGLASASVRPLTTGGWWLPTPRPGTLFDFGESGRAYALSEPNGGFTYYLWNPAGVRRIKIRIPKASRMEGVPPVRWSQGANGEAKGEELSLTIGPDPIRLENMAAIPVPLDAFDSAKAEVKTLVSAMKKRGIIDAGRFQEEASTIAFRFNRENPWLSLSEIQSLLMRMRALLRPYAWIEAEPGGIGTNGVQITGAIAQSFDEVSERVGASNGQVLLVGARPSTSAATATYRVEVQQTGPYNLWVAASPDAPLTFRLDGQPVLDEAVAPQAVGQPYAGGTLVWTHYGVATLPKGVHTLEMRAGSAPCVVDTLLVTPGAFIPDGPNPPPVKP